MAMKRTLLLFTAAVAALWIGPRIAESCGPWLIYWRFNTYNGTAAGELQSGTVGVLRPHYYRSDLLFSYRLLSGVPRGGDEKLSLSREARLADPNAPPRGLAAWNAARKEIAGDSALAGVNPDRKLAADEYQSYPNCLDDAFDSAAATLHKRVVQWGAASKNVAEWVKGQDQVFANCSAGASIPEELYSTDPLLMADRKYQMAAAQFYAEQYGPAAAGFDEIADDARSPWRGIAPYLAARACIRQATVGGDAGGLSRAAERLDAIIADPKQKQFHAAAESLLGFVKARMDPQKRLEELGAQLMKPRLGPQLVRVVGDYTSIWDRMEEKGQKPDTSKSEVADWIATFQAKGDALGKWRARKSLPWLIAALVSVDPKDAAVPSLIAAAHAVKPDSPAYASVTYYGIRLEIQRGERDAARSWADQAMTQKVSDASLNLLRSERMNLARDWAEFLRFATRKPVASDGEDGEEPIDAAAGSTLALDEDTTEPLNTIVPLKLWIESTQTEFFPSGLRANIAQAAWVRAVILRDAASARTLAERVGQLKPELAAEMKKYLAEPDPAAANFKAVFLMLRAPGLEPVVRTGKARETAVMERDNLRDNWWKLSNLPRTTGGDSNYEALYDLYPKGIFDPTDFLPQDERAAGEDEWSKIKQRATNSVNYLCAETLEWARAHASDPSVPEALHLAVEATHYGPKDAEGTKYSKQAFELLHKAYPKSEWAAMTKYYY
jgi:hypothetical protein